MICTKVCWRRTPNEKKSGAGQYFTPRPLIDSMVAVMQPTLDDIIQDPAAGTGGFLIAANRYLREHSDPDALDRGAATQVSAQHLLRYGARAGRPPAGVDEPDAARARFRPRMPPASATATRLGRKAKRSVSKVQRSFSPTHPSAPRRAAGCPRAPTSPSPPATSSSAFCSTSTAPSSPAAAPPWCCPTTCCSRATPAGRSAPT